MSVVHLPPLKTPPMKAAITPDRPRVLVMARPVYPVACDHACAHIICLRARAHWRHRTCVECFQIIAIGEHYTASGDDLRHHGQCPQRTP